MATWFGNYAQSQKQDHLDVQAQLEQAGQLGEKNEQDHPQPPGKKKYCKEYKLGDAVRVLHAGRIARRIAQATSLPPGMKGYLAHYSKARASVIKRLTAEEKEQALKLAEKWNRECAPEELQKQWAS